MRKFIIGFLLGSLIFNGIVTARDRIIDFSEDSVERLNEIIRKIWFDIDDKAIRDATPKFIYHDTDNDKAICIHYDAEGTEDWEFAFYYGQDYEGGDFNIDSTYRKPFLAFGAAGEIFMPYIASGTTQANAGAVKGELWADSDDAYSIKLGQ